MPPDQASWGQILADASGLYDVAWWLMVFPGAFLVVTTLSFNLLGDGLRDALDVGRTVTATQLNGRVVVSIAVMIVHAIPAMERGKEGTCNR